MYKNTALRGYATHVRRHRFALATTSLAAFAGSGSRKGAVSALQFEDGGRLRLLGAGLHSFPWQAPPPRVGAPPGRGVSGAPGE